MLFNSFEFLTLLTITFLLYYLQGLRNFQVWILILSSLFFYAYHEPILVLLLLFSVLINIVSSYYVVYGNKKFRRAFATAGVALNLSILVFFKYSPLFATTFLDTGDSLREFFLMLPLPIGISFFTFQGISLIVDVFRGKYATSEALVPPSLISHGKQILFFKAFFPQLISGPIVKAHDFIPQIETKYFSKIQWEFSFKHIVIGYFLKMVVADNLKDYTFWIEYPYFHGYSSHTLLVMLFGYSCQIFADFAGYSLIAIGVAALFGYYFPINFHFPYVASSFKDFWKRWHISLSSFLMEYLYIPLGGNRRGKVRTYINLMVVMLLGGLWHGAAWSYALWGGLHGAALVVEKFVSEWTSFGKSTLISALRGIVVFTFVTMAWLLFKLPRIEEVWGFCGALRNNVDMQPDLQIIVYVLLYSFPIIVYHVGYLLKRTYFHNKFYIVENMAYALMIFFVLVNSGSPGNFIYFQF